MSYQTTQTNKFAILSKQDDEAPVAETRKTYIQSESDVSPSTLPNDDRRKANRANAQKPHGHRPATRGRARDRHESGTGVRKNQSKRSGEKPAGANPAADPDAEVEVEEDSIENGEASEAASEPTEPEPAYRSLEEFSSSASIEQNNVRERRALDGKFASSSRKTGTETVLQIGGSSTSKKTRTRVTAEKDTIEVSPIVTDVRSAPKGGRRPGNNNNRDRQNGSKQGGRRENRGQAK